MLLLFDPGVEVWRYLQPTEDAPWEQFVISPFKGGIPQIVSLYALAGFSCAAMFWLGAAQ